MRRYVATLIPEGLAHLGAFTDEQASSLAGDFFARAKWAMRERNHVVHNLWPAQADDPQFGWRTVRGESDDIMINRTQSDLGELVLHIVKLFDDCEKLLMRVRPPTC
jgi:hypothetical protein